MVTNPQPARTGLGKRLQALLAVVAASIVAVGAVGYVRTVSIEERISYLDGRVSPLRELKAVSDLHAIDVVDTVHKVVFGRFTPAEGAKRLAAAALEIDQVWQAYTHGPLTAEDQRHVHETAPLMLAARSAIDEARDAMLRDDVVALDDFRRNRMYQAIDPLTAQLNELAQHQVQEVDLVARVAQRDLTTSRNVSTAALALAGLLALFVGFRFSRRLASSLSAMQAVVRSAASGDHAARASLEGDDELAAMAADIDAMNESLEQARREIEAHATVLAASEKKAREANIAKSIFLSSMSHELRTPLNVILGHAQLLLRAQPSATQKRQLTSITEAGGHLLQLIDDVLSLSKVEAGTMELYPRPFSPAQLVRRVANLLAFQATAKGLALDVRCDASVPERVLGDEGKLRQVLVNLLGNAIKFTRAGTVSVAVGYPEGKLDVRVTDTGPGISEEERACLFETFYQGSAGRASATGTGLGLHISQTLVRLMGGDIRVESTVGAGSTFSFAVALPCAPDVSESGAVDAKVMDGRLREPRDAVALLSSEQRARLLLPLQLGDLAEALRVADSLSDRAIAAPIRAVIETYRVDGLLEALREGV